MAGSDIPTETTRARIIMMIHDALWAEAPSAEVAKVSELMRTIMTNAGKLDVPLEVDLT